MITGWIQSADYSAIDLDDLSVASALDYFNQHDWASEWQLEAELAGQGQDNCPAGLGLNAEAGHILHICPRAEDKNMVLFSMPQASSKRGPLRKRRKIQEMREGVSDTTCQHLIQLYFQEEYDSILTEMRR